MNVLFISDYAAPYKGNFIPSLECLAAEASKQQSRDSLFLFPESARNVAWMPDFQREHKVYFLPNAFFGKSIKLNDLHTLRHIIRENHIDIIHCHFLTYNYSLFVARYTVARHCKFICHVHNYFVIPSTKSAPIKRFVMKHLYDTIIGVSEHVAEGVRKAINHKNIVSIDNAIYFQRLDKYEQISLKDNADDIVALMAGWPAEVKGVDIAVQAIQQVRKDGKNLVLRIMQSGDFEHTKEVIRKAIGEMPNWVKILPPREDVATYYHAADIFLSCSRTEGCPYALFEAAYVGKRLIASSLPLPYRQIPNIYI